MPPVHKPDILSGVHQAQRKRTKTPPMPCYHPITGYQQHEGGSLTFYNRGDRNEIQIPCGQCIGCRLRISREWATRAMHEAQMHKYNCTITLTYNDENLPEQESLKYEHYQQFMRKLRKALGRGNPGLLHTHAERKRIRFYMGGEYGEQCRNCGQNKIKCVCGNWIPELGRPHYHACLFGIHFADRQYHSTTSAGSKIYKSITLDKLWGKGYASIGELTFESAAYIARYIMKKRTGDKKQSYEITNAQTGEIQIRKKEFNQMSRNPGLGKSWLEKFHADVYPKGKVIIRGHQANPPRYYDQKYKEANQLEYENLKYERTKIALEQVEHHTEARLLVQEQVQIAKTKSLKRGKLE